MLKAKGEKTKQLLSKHNVFFCASSALFDKRLVKLLRNPFAPYQWHPALQPPRLSYSNQQREREKERKMEGYINLFLCIVYSSTHTYMHTHATTKTSPNTKLNQYLAKPVFVFLLIIYEKDMFLMVIIFCTLQTLQYLPSHILQPAEEEKNDICVKSKASSSKSLSLCFCTIIKSIIV